MRCVAAPVLGTKAAASRTLEQLMALVGVELYNTSEYGQEVPFAFPDDTTPDVTVVRTRR